jgi:hypothetical protein
MSIPEFNRAADLYNKRSFIAILGPSAVCLLCVFAYMPFQRGFESFLSTRFGSFTVDVLTTLPMCLPTIIMILWIVWLSRRIERQAGIPCPHCAKSLAGARAIVVASRNCPFCGKRVIDEEKWK